MVLATHNRDKVREIRKILSGLPVPLKGLEDFPPAPEPRETGKTLEANALIKARAAARRTGCLSLADDTGLEVAALRGAPGVISARFAGPGCTYADNNRKLLRLMARVPSSRRRAVFRCVVAAVFPDGEERIFEGRCPGRIVAAPRGSGGFGYDPVFRPAGQRRTFAEMTLAGKNRVSHRSKAFRRSRNFLTALWKRRPERFCRRSKQKEARP